MMRTMAAVVLALMVGALHTTAWGQVNVFTDDFSTNTSATYTTSGAIGSSAWSVTRSGADWGARRNTSPLQLELTNDASATANANGWVFAYTSTSSFSSPYNTTLDQNSGMVTWYFNMRQIRSDPAGLLSPSYGVAFVLGATSTAITTAGTDGYAVVLGNTGSTDPVRLVKFTSAITSVGNTAPPTANDLIVSNTSGLTDFGTNYLSVKVTYHPAIDEWELFLRDDGGSFADPMSGSLTSQGTTIDNTHTGVSLATLGGYWQGSTAANQPAFFDNVSVLVTPFLFRSSASGNWSAPSTWEQSTNNGATWDAAASTPTASEGAVLIQSPHTVTVTASLAVDELTIESGGTLHVNNGTTLTVQNGTGDDVTVNGTLSTAGSINGTGTIAINGGVFRVDEGGWGGNTNVYTYDATSALVFNNTSGFYGVGSDAVWWPDPISNVTVQNTGGVELNTPRTVTGLFQTSTGVKNSFGNDLTVSGTVQLNGGGYFDNFSPTYTSTGLLVYNANYGVYNEWTGSGTTPGYGIPAGVVIQNAATVTMPAGDRGIGGNMNIANGTLVRNASFQLSMTGNWVRAAGSFHTHNDAPTVFLGTGVQTVTADGGEVFGSLNIDKSAGGVTLNDDVAVTQTLTLTSGIVTTGANALRVSSTGTISRTAGHVNGSLEKAYGTGSHASTYHIGNGSLYTPVALANFNVTTAGSVRATTTAGEHPDVGTSGIDPLKNVNRYWSLTKDGSLAFTAYDATFTFDASDIDGGANTSVFEVAKYDGSWSALTAGTRTGTSTEVVGATSFSDFVVGEVFASALDHFLVEAVGGGPIGSQVAGVPFDIMITAQDAGDNTVTSFTGTVEITSTGFLSAGSGTTVAFVNGVLASHSVTITNTGSFTITATETGDTPEGTSNSFVVSAAALDNFLVEAAGGGVIPDQDAGTPFNIQITARDAFDNTVTGFASTVDITSSGTLSLGAGTTAGFTAGVLASHGVAISNTGLFTITATHSFGPEFGTSNSFTVNVGPLDNFLVELAGGGPIGTQTAGLPFNVQVTARDAGGNTVTAFGGTVDITSSGTLSSGGGTTPAFSGGILASHSVTVTSAGGVTITATETGDTPFGTSNVFTVDPAALSSFVVEAAGGGAIGSQVAGVPFTIDVTAVDAFANTVTGFGGTVDITAGGPIAAGGGTSPGFSSGVLAGHAITVNAAGLYTLDAELTGGGPTGASNSFSVSHAPLSKFLVEADGGGVIPSQVAGTPFDIQVTALDAFDNIVTSFSSTVEITSTGTLLSGGGTTVSFTSGILATHAVAISNTGSFTITATHTFGLEDGISNLFAVNPGPLDNYLVEAFGGGPVPSQLAGAPFDIQVTARDAFNNTVPSFVGTVDITSSGLLSAGGGMTGAFTSGVLAPHNVEISNTGSFTITATTTGGGEMGTSNVFVVDAGPLDHFLVEAAGGGAIGTQTAGIGFAIDVTARDINGNVVVGFVGTVDMSSTGTLSAGGGTTGAFTAGILAGHNLTITNTGAFDITATRTGGSEEGTSNLFDVDPGPLSHYGVEAAGGGVIGTQTAGTPFAIQVMAQDAFNNTVAAFTGTVDITTAGSLVSGGGTTAAFSGGILASHNVTFSTAGTFDLTATTTGGPETGTSDAFLVDPAPLNTFLVEEAGGGPIGTQAVGAPFAIQVTAKDFFGNTVTTFTGTTDITTTGSFLSGGGTTAPFVAGFLASHAVNFASAGNFTISAKRTGGPEIGASNIFTVSATFFTILATADANGTILPAGPVAVAYGANRTFTMAPNPGYQIDEVYVDGLPLGDDPTYTFINVTSDHTIHATYEPVTEFLTISPDSIIANDPLTGRIYKPVRRGKGKMPNWANLLAETVIQGGFQPGASESDGAGGMRVGIAHMGEVSPNKWKPHADSARIRGWVRLTKWDFRKSIGKPFSVLQKTLKDRTGEHVDEPRGFDYLGVESNPKPFVKQRTSLPPKRHNNELFAELVALKFNIAASQLGKTPIGFGELIYDNDGHPCDELTIVEISAKTDTAMTYWEERDGQEYADLFDAIYDINRAFVGEVDTVQFENGGQLVLRGEVDIDDVPFLKPGVIVARQLPRTSDETETEDDDFDDEDYEDGMPVAAKLYQNYPNPFNPSTTIAFRLREESVVTLTIYNMLGQEVAALLSNEEFDEGLQRLQFNAAGLSSGVYFYRIQAQGIEEEGLKSIETGKMLLLK